MWEVSFIVRQINLQNSIEFLYTCNNQLENIISFTSTIKPIQYLGCHLTEYIGHLQKTEVLKLIIKKI